MLIVLHNVAVITKSSSVHVSREFDSLTCIGSSYIFCLHLHTAKLSDKCWWQGSGTEDHPLSPISEISHFAFLLLTCDSVE